MHGCSASAWRLQARLVLTRYLHRRRCRYTYGSVHHRRHATSGFRDCHRATCGHLATGNCTATVTSGALAIRCAGAPANIGGPHIGCTVAMAGKCVKVAGTATTVTPRTASTAALPAAGADVVKTGQPSAGLFFWPRATYATSGISNLRVANSWRKASNACTTESAPRAVFCKRMPSTCWMPTVANT